MTLSPALRRVLLAIAVFLFLGFAWLGLSGGVNQVSQSTTLGQKAQTLTQAGYGLFALLSAITAFWGSRWRRLVQGGWVISVTLAGGLASVVWGGTSIWIGLVAGVASLLVALGITWLLRAGLAT